MKITSNLLVSFYRIWHGKFHLKGAGYLLRRASGILPALRHYPLFVPIIGYVPIDISDDSGMAWLNQSLGEDGQEEGLLKCAKKYVPSPKCIWDVGANGGNFGTQILQAYPNMERLYLFEPNPAMHEMLETVEKSRPGIALCLFALSDTNGKATLSFDSGTSSMASLLGSSKGSQIDVDVKTGDGFLSQNPDAIPDLIIIDVEGAEKNVLSGMQDLLNRHKPVVIFEQIFFDPAILDTVMPGGYTRFTIDDRTGKLIQGFNLKAGHNGIFLPLC